MARHVWTLADAPPLFGKQALVTGATGGLGFETSLGLARRGARVLLTGRNPDKGAAALERIRRSVPDADIAFAPLDLSSLAAVAAFAIDLGAGGEPIHILVNNAGVMALPRREVTADGFERQFGVNYLAHFVLTALLAPILALAEGGARVVQLASLAHRDGRFDFDDLQGEAHYDPWTAYRQSKLAMLVFALELDRRARAGGWPITSIAAHPGWAYTDIITNGPGEGRPSLKTRLMNFAFRTLGQSAEAGALPILFAATAPEAQGGGYYGPSGSAREIKGPVGPSRIMPQAADPAAGRQLWDVSERLTGTHFDIDPRFTQRD